MSWVHIHKPYQAIHSCPRRASSQSEERIWTAPHDTKPRGSPSSPAAAEPQPSRSPQKLTVFLRTGQRKILLRFTNPKSLPSPAPRLQHNLSLTFSFGHLAIACRTARSFTVLLFDRNSFPLVELRRRRVLRARFLVGEPPTRLTDATPPPPPSPTRPHRGFHRSRRPRAYF